MSRRFDLLVLDLDGTLVDSEALLVGLVNEVLQGAGCPIADPAAVAATIGLPLDEVFRRAAPGVSGDVIDALCVTYRGHADRQEFVQQFCLYPEVAATLTGLHAAGLRLVVGTSKGRATATDIVRHCGIADYIDDVIGGDSVARGKPHPEMVHRAQALFGTESQRTLMVGDTSFDIEMGKAARVGTCAVTYGMHAAEALRRLRPDFLIEQFDQLNQLVRGTEDTI